MIQKSILFYAALVFSFSGISAEAASKEGSFSYRVRLPVTEKSCADEAGLLARRFAGATKNSSAVGQCLGQAALVDKTKSYQVNILVLTYKAVQQLTPVRASFEVPPSVARPSGPNWGSGAYSSYDECLADLSTQSAHFAEQTGLETVAAYCEAAMPGVDNSFVLKLESFVNSPKEWTELKRLHLFVSFPDATPTDDKGVSAAFDIKGVKLVKKHRNEFFYYSQYPLQLALDTWSGFSNQASCLAEINEFISIYNQAVPKANAKTATILPRCVPSAYSSTMLVVSNRSQYLSSGTFPRDFKYWSMEECRADKARVLEELRARSSKVFGGYCTRDVMYDSRFHLVVISGETL